MNLKRLFGELKRRKVYSVAVAYVVFGAGLIQLVTSVFPSFDFPGWSTRLVIIAIALGFPVSLVLSWFFDLTRYGIARTPDLVEIGRTSAASEHSIAVLPFVDLSPGKDHDYFSDGIAEEILTALSKIENLRVAARRSSFWFKDRQADLREVASKLNVGHVLEGSVRRDDNRVRVTAELIDARRGFTIWSDTFEREMQSIFALQDEITRAIVEALKLKLAIAAQPPPQARSLAAYDSYLQGAFYADKSTEEALRKSLEHFSRALQLDPRFGRAWTGIAKAWLWLADAYVAPREAYSNMRDAALNALKIDKDDAEAHVYLGETKRILDWNMDGAEREFCRAVALDPNSTPSNYFSAAFFAAIGDRDKALQYLKRTATIDPASLWVNNAACELYRYFGLYDEAIAAGERALQLDPAFIFGEPLLAALYREMGRFDDAIALYEKAETINGRPAFGHAITFAKMNQPDKARDILANAVATRGSYTPGDAVAHVLVALGEHEEAIRELERACEERSSSVHFIGIAPEFAPLRPDKRFVAMVKRMGLDPEKVFAVGA